MNPRSRSERQPITSSNGAAAGGVAAAATTASTSPSASRSMRRQTSFTSDDSFAAAAGGATASTASYNRRREETMARKREIEGERQRNMPPPARPVARTPSTSSNKTLAKRLSNNRLSASLAAGLQTSDAPTATDKTMRRQKPTSPSQPTSSSIMRQHHQQPTPSSTPPPAPNRPAAPGTVSSMNPDPAVALQATAKVFEAAAYMAAKRQDAILVVDAQGHLAGILTDKDLAYRVVANGLDPRTTPVAHAMTANPVSVTTSTTSHQALNLMIAGQFRHLPVVESDDESSEDSDVQEGNMLVHRGSAVGSPGEAAHANFSRPSTASPPRRRSSSGGVVGVLDITKCLYEALEKLDRAYESSRRLHEALEGVEREWSIHSGSVGRYAEVLRDQLACPDLAGLLSGQTNSPPMVGTRASVFEAAQRMRESRETAVLVFAAEADGSGTLAGIFTSKDLVLRVLAGGLDPNVTLVTRVMTPHPDCVTPQTPVVDALRKMHSGRFLHLPVIDDSGTIEGMVDVLKLTYTTLSQMTTIQGEPGEGPMWNRFWDGALTGGAGSSIADTRSHRTGLESEDGEDDDAGARNDDQEYGDDGELDDGHSTVAPDDSASMFPSRFRRRDPLNASSPLHNHHSAAAAAAASSALDTATSASSLPGHLYTFKLTHPKTNQAYRFTSTFDSLGVLRHAVASKLGLGLETVLGALSYVDDEDDFLPLESDADLDDAVIMARAGGWGKLRLVVTLVDRPQLDDKGLAEGRRNLRDLVAITGEDPNRGSPRKDQKKKKGGVVPMIMTSGVALACAFLLGRAFKFIDMAAQCLRRVIPLTTTRSAVRAMSSSAISYPRPHLIPKTGSYPAGWVAGGLASGVKKPGLKDLTLMASPGHSIVASAVFTQNSFAAAPVQVSKAIINETTGVRALVVNSGCANACTGDQGLKDAWRMSRETDTALGGDAGSKPQTLVMSTGVIGQHLDMDKIVPGIAELAKNVGPTHENWLSAAEGIMTTDTFPKLRSTVFEGDYSMAGWSKGAGMSMGFPILHLLCLDQDTYFAPFRLVHPNMATMLSAVFTDASISKRCLDAATRYAADRSFNAISIDGDTSTNDTFAVLANAASKGAAVIDDLESDTYRLFRDRLTQFAAELAKLIVRDGEGATKFVEIHVKGAKSFADARQVSSTIATSPLVKTALYGQDANWGRVVCALGYSGVPVKPENVNLYLSTPAIDEALHLFKNGAPFDTDEEKAAQILEHEDLKLEIGLGEGKEEAKMYTTDLTHGYITINADYRS
ncbi:hypothetical protein HDU86_003415 [Geranomyces michiganensis]|nr:hypothetical protein HDU86_003415 [Geranomyces michiganensis]